MHHLQPELGTFVASAGRQDHRSFQMNGALSSYKPYELIKLFSITYII